ncbi:PTS system N-acetylgalactosamine-specific transporter subunit IID [Raoultella terrigena]|uniref:PTS system N-acetylgalactosamine-specific transporter subunit IID n=1 Tax=Raoultella terrigena TaxID=577 RepID=A0A4U9D7X3_RAOTE|nr:PTS system N-acetylgalactosamine-specific transporter subunit IID [Raoultella terrigena]
MASNQTTLPGVSTSEETLLSGVNENVYEDQALGAELTKKDINRVAWRSMLLQASFNYERMQASGWPVWPAAGAEKRSTPTSAIWHVP